MSNPVDSREGLSPSPPNILDLFDEDGESDLDFEPSEEQSTEANADDTDGEYTGTA